MRIRCPTCRGLGTVDKVFPAGTVMGYCGPNGERWPQEMCQTCNGEKWVDDGRFIRPAYEDEAQRAIRKMKGDDRG